MAVATFKCEFPRRQAMLSIRERQEVKRPEIPFEQADSIKGGARWDDGIGSTGA